MLRTFCSVSFFLVYHNLVAAGTFQFGECNTGDHSGETPVDPSLCLSPRMGTETLSGKYMGVFLYGETYVSAFWNERLSAHANWSMYDTQAYDLFQSGVIKRQDYAFIQLGNVGYDRLRLRAGRFLPPFGVNAKNWTVLMEEHFKDKSFYPTTQPTVQLDFDTFVSSQYQVGVSADTNKSGRFEENRVVSARAMFDMTAVENVRSVFSYARHRDKSFKLGFGMISSTKHHDFTSIEWARSYLIMPRQSRQMFHVLYDSRKTGRQSWHVAFLSEEHQHRIAMIGTGLRLGKMGEYKFGGGYYSNWEASNRMFFFMQALELGF